MPAGYPDQDNRTWVRPGEGKRVTVRIARDVWEALYAPAAANHRSQTAEAEARLRASLEPATPADVIEASRREAPKKGR